MICDEIVTYMKDSSMFIQNHDTDNELVTINVFIMHLTAYAEAIRAIKFAYKPTYCLYLNLPDP